MKQLKNCKECNAKLKGRYKRFCGKPTCREEAKKEHNVQCRIRNAKDKLKVCCCGCGKQFKTGIAGRKYFNSACRTRVSVAKGRKKGTGGICKICGAWFVPRNQRHVTCSPECAKKAKRQKDELRYKNRVPATHRVEVGRPGVAIWDGVKRDDDYDHKQYIEYKKQMKAENGRKCLKCGEPCYGFDFHCERHKLENYRKADNHAFIDEGGSARQSASGVFG